MIILGISDSIESHACLIKDGVLLAAHAEERFTRLKSDSGYPYNSVNKIFELVIEPIYFLLLLKTGKTDNEYLSK